MRVGGGMEVVVEGDDVSPLLLFVLSVTDGG